MRFRIVSSALAAVFALTLPAAYLQPAAAQPAPYEINVILALTGAGRVYRQC